MGLSQHLTAFTRSFSSSDQGTMYVTVALAVVAIVAWLWQRRRAAKLDMHLIPGPKGLPLLGCVLELIRPDWHHVFLEWANKYGGIYRLRALWFDALIVTDPSAVAAICGRGDGALDKASVIYTPINQMCSPRAHPNLLTSPADPTWRAVRKAVAVAFSVQNIRKKFPVIRQCSQQLIDQLVSLSNQSATDGKGPVTVDVDQCALRVTLDVIGLAGFGHDFGCVKAPLRVTEPAPSQHLLRVLPRCFTEVMMRLANPFRALTPESFRTGAKGEQSFLSFQREMKVLLRKCLLRPTPPASDDATISAQLWRAYYETNGSEMYGKATATVAGTDTTRDTHGTPSNNKTTDDETVSGLLPPPLSPLQRFFNRLNQLSSLVSNKPLQYNKVPHNNTQQGSGRLIEAERILSEIGILFIEGFETTGHTIAWTLFNISVTPGVQERIALELSSLGLLSSPSHPTPPTHLDMEHLHQLTYLTACVKEAMRVLPVVSVMGRAVGPKPTRVGPYMVPARTPVGIPLFAIQNSLHNWERGEEYIPERWIKVPVESYVVGTMAPLDMCQDAINARLRLATHTNTGITPHTTAAAEPAGAEHTHTRPVCVTTGAGKGVGVDTGNGVGRPNSPSSTLDNTDMSPGDSPTGLQSVMRNTSVRGKGAERQGEKDKETGNGDSKRSASGAQVRFAPFSEGPRNCVGQTLAKVEVLTFLTLLLSHYSVELAPEMGGRAGMRALESTHLTLQMRGTQGVRMLLHPRWL